MSSEWLLALVGGLAIGILLDRVLQLNQPASSGHRTPGRSRRDERGRLQHRIDEACQSPEKTPRTSLPASGQALVEFALVVPILMVLVIGLADLGRVFAAGVITESSARDAAEIVAQQYLKDYPLGAPASAPAGYYEALHLRAAQVVCAELKSLPNTNYGGGSCDGMPVVLACVHDGVDDACGTEAFGDPIPAGCSSLATAPGNAPPAGSEPSRFVEVRVCYKFTPLTHTLLLPVPEIYLQPARVFTVADY